MGRASTKGVSWTEQLTVAQVLPSPWYVPPPLVHAEALPSLQVPLDAQQAPVTGAQGLGEQLVPFPW
jgi:hypothetical protein